MTPSQTIYMGHTSIVSRVSLFPRHCTLGHMSPVPRVIHHRDPVSEVPRPQSAGLSKLSDPAPGFSHPQSQGDPPSRHYTYGHMYVVSRVTPSQAICMLSQVHSLQSQPLPQTLYFRSHIHSPGNEPISQNLYWGTRVHSLLGDPTSQTLYLESHIQSL